LAPNELALLAGVVVLVGTWRLLCDGGRWPVALAVVAALGVVWATGSRTGLAMLVLGVAVVVAHVRRPPVWAVVGGLVAAAAGSAVVLGTGLLAGFVSRDGTGVSTLESRMVAWGAARSWADSLWQAVFGGGLSVKVIRVRGQWWTEQPLDSSWVSVFVQAGALGLFVALGWVLWTAAGARRAPDPLRALLLGLLVLLTGRSLLESGLFDATPAFLLLTAVSLAAERGTRPSRETA
jgi:O-antigen ligase